MTTEQEPFNFFLDRSNVAIGDKYPDMVYVHKPAEAIGDMDFQTVDYPGVPDWHEPAYSEPAPVYREPRTPSWSYAENPLFATLPADVKARMEYESTPLENFASQSLGDRLAQRVQEQTDETPDVYRSIYHQIETERSVGSASQMTQALRATETVHEPQPQPEQLVHAADLPTSNAAYYEPVPLWEAPLRESNGNVGSQRGEMRGPLPDTLTPRLKTPAPAMAQQEALAPVTAEAFAATENVAEQAEAAPGLSKDGNEAFLGRIARLAEQQDSQDSETIPAISTAESDETVTQEQATSAGDQLVARVTTEATVATLETKPPKTVRTYGQMLLDAAKFKFRVARDETSGTFVGEIVDSEGTVQIDKIRLDENAEGERMRTTRRLIGRMSQLRMKIPKLPKPRIA